VTVLLRDVEGGAELTLKRERDERQQGAGLPAKVDVAAARAFAAEGLEGAQVAEKFGNASFSVGGKVFAFTRPEGLVLKLPPDAMARVIAEREAGPLVMGTRAMREWVLLRLEGPEGYRGELDLMRVAMEFVGAGRLGRTPRGRRT
jgi:hypothetical protein